MQVKYIKVYILHFRKIYIKNRWLTWTSIPEPSQNLIYAIAKNITHTKKLEVERNLLVANLTKANAEFKQLSYTTSHDLRAPVNNFLSLLSLIDTTK